MSPRRARRVTLRSNDGRSVPALALGSLVTYRDNDCTWTVELRQQTDDPRAARVVRARLSKPAALAMLRGAP